MRVVSLVTCHYKLIMICRLNRLLGQVVISQGGVVPHIAAVSNIVLGLSALDPEMGLQELLPSKSSKSKKEGDEA